MVHFWKSLRMPRNEACQIPILKLLLTSIEITMNSDRRRWEGEMRMDQPPSMSRPDRQARYKCRMYCKGGNGLDNFRSRRVGNHDENRARRKRRARKGILEERDRHSRRGYTCSDGWDWVCSCPQGLAEGLRRVVAIEVDCEGIRVRAREREHAGSYLHVCGDTSPRQSMGVAWEGN